MAWQADRGLYRRLQLLTLSEASLRQFGYPRPHRQQSGKACIYNLEQVRYSTIPGPNARNCERCRAVYRIDGSGRPVRREVCQYHSERVLHNPRPCYQCCRRNLDSKPCTTAPQHVTGDIDPNNMNGFIDTQHTTSTGAESIYALDCEMVYTAAGREVAAISVVDSSCQLVYETMVLPDNPIVDYNTKYSGITQNHFRGVNTNLQDVHSRLLALFGSRTILVGHSLNYDLLRLRLLHDLVVDTSIVYPHPKGLPFRNSLAFLKTKYLGTGASPNYNLKCRKDAEASMKLARLKYM